jgi:hydrogenase expression/formation protein HypE
MEEVIKLVHGDGGKQTKALIEQLFYKNFNNTILLQQQDAAVITNINEALAFTTDAFVVKPLFFKGGNIGKLSICGTVNDLVVSGAMPLYLSASFIIEEGFPINLLEIIVKSMSETCIEAGVTIVTGDTKVVEKGSMEGIFINTTGLGKLINGYKIKPIETGDKIIVTGTIGEHGTAIALERYHINVTGDFKSDCAPLKPLIEKLKDYFPYIKIMRDPTRGGLATVLDEFCDYSNLGVHLIEDDIPIRLSVKAANELLGMEPLYMACEGRMVLVVKQEKALEILNIIRSLNIYEEANIIGEFVETPHKKICVENYFGGKRIVPPLEGNMLPRIC